MPGPAAPAVMLAPPTLPPPAHPELLSSQHGSAALPTPMSSEHQYVRWDSGSSRGSRDDAASAAVAAAAAFVEVAPVPRPQPDGQPRQLHRLAQALDGRLSQTGEVGCSLGGYPRPRCSRTVVSPPPTTLPPP